MDERQGITIYDITINQSAEQEMAKAKASVASGVNAVEDDEAKEAKKEKKGGNKVANPDDVGPRRRQIGLPMKAGTREMVLGNNLVGTGRRKRGGSNGSLS